MKVVFAGGGTAGHINPALAIASYIREQQPDAQIMFIGNKNSMEEKLVRRAGYHFKDIQINGFNRKMTPKAMLDNATTVFKAVKAITDAKKIIREFAPDVCIGTGGYVSGPVVKAANKLGIRTLIHEQNAFAGVTTKMLSKDVDVVMLAIADAQAYIPNAKRIEVTGNPIRGEVFAAQKSVAKNTLGLDSRPVILSFGGSLGARAINEAMAGLVARSGKDGRYQHIHAYGQYGKWFVELVGKKGTDIDKCDNLDVRKFINNMDMCLAAADLVICRAGAITISEIQATGKPAILIPSPNVAENHQYHNAMALVNAGAAEILEEKDLSEQSLMSLVDKLVNDKSKLDLYSKNARKSAIIDARERIYAIIMEQAK